MAPICPAEGRNGTVEDVIEEIGFGRAQIRLFFLAYGVWFVEAFQVNCGVVFTAFLAEAMGWSHVERASLGSLTYLGIAIGTTVGGCWADNVGRRPPLLASYALTCVATLSVLPTADYWLVSLTRIFQGFSWGLGMPVSVALVSEAAPAKSRVVLQGARNLYWSSGAILGCLIVIFDDASYQHMHWRVVCLLSLVPALAFGPLAALLLQESPSFLAERGRHTEARRSLEAMRHANGRALMDISYQERQDRAVAQPRAGAERGSQFLTVVNRHYFWTTLTLGVGSFIASVVLYGHSYAFPLLAKSRMRGHPGGMQPGYQGLMQNVISMPVNLTVIPISVLMSRRSLLVLGCMVGAVGFVLFAWVGTLPPASPHVDALFLVFQNTPAFTVSLMFLALFQLSVDLYPVSVAATSSAVIQVAGRIGCLISSFLYEACAGQWQIFYVMLACLCLVTATMALALLPSTASQHRLEDEGATKPLTLSA